MEIISEHGGDIYRLAEELKMQERKIIDFSVPVNPLKVSKKVKAEIRKSLKYLHNYPDTEAKRLRKGLAQHHGIDPEMILCGNGSTELISLIVRALEPKKVLIPVPTFLEYERAVRRAQSKDYGAQTQYLVLKAEENFEIKPDEFIAALKGEGNPEGHTIPCDMAFICNPNNPTGLLVEKDSVMKIAEAASDLSCNLVVDEAFIDFCQGTVPDLPPSQKQGVESVRSRISVIKEVQNNPHLIVLRSMSPFYALPGLRLGYGVFPRDLIDRLKQNKDPWTVNSLAQRAAPVALKDKTYQEETLRLLREEKNFLEKSFKKIGIEFIPSDANFYLLRIKNAHKIYLHLKKKGILVGDCSHFRGLDNTYIRIAVKSHRENTILIKELSTVLQK